MSNKRYWLRIVVFLILFYLIVNLGNTYWELNKAAERINRAEKHLKDLSLEDYQLSQRLNEVESDFYIELQVRNNLHLGRRGEQVVVLPENISVLKPLEPPTDDNFKENWELWLEAFRII